MADIRLLFNKSCAKKRRKINSDEEASKLLPPSTDTDEQHEAPVVIERESDETLQSETVVVGLDVAAQVGLPPSESESEYESETDGYGYDTEPEEKDHHCEGDDLVPADECSGSESAREEDGDGNNKFNASSSLSVSAPGKDGNENSSCFFSGSTGPPHR